MKASTKWVLWLQIDRFAHSFAINYTGDSEREARKIVRDHFGWKRLPAHASVELNREQSKVSA